MSSKTYADKRKEIIIDAAHSVFCNLGYSLATIQNIIDEASISRGGLYAHFNNIDDIFIEVLKREDETFIHSYEPNYSAFKNLELLLNEIKDKIKDDQTLTKAKSEFLLIHSSLDYPYLEERHEMLKTTFKNILEVGIQSKEFRIIDTKIFSELIISTINGIAINQYYRDNKECSYDIIFEEFLKNLSKLLKEEQ